MKPTIEQIEHFFRLVDKKLVTKDNLQRYLENPNSLLNPILNGTVIKIDRSQPFNPAELIGAGWAIAEQDELSLALSEVNLDNVHLVTTLKDGENSVQGEEKLRRLKATGEIRLDAKVFQTLWENKELIPKSWKGKRVYFDGTILRDPYGRRFVLYLCWYGDKWSWGCRWLRDVWRGSEPSAVLAK